MTAAIPVVGALIRSQDRVLVAQRPPGKHEALLWEFPGGKIEPGETPEAALAREIDEELGVRIKVGERFGVVRHAYPGRLIELSVYWAEILEGEPRAHDCHALRWVGPAELDELEFAPADVPLVARLKSWPGF